jgi:hypothetical protein
VKMDIGNSELGSLKDALIRIVKVSEGRKYPTVVELTQFGIRIVMTLGDRRQSTSVWSWTQIEHVRPEMIAKMFGQLERQLDDG